MLLVKSGWIAEIPGLGDSAEAEAVAERHRGPGTPSHHQLCRIQQDSTRTTLYLVYTYNLIK